MEDWKIKDYKTRCYNLQNRLTPHKVKEAQLVAQMRKIKKERKCDELTAWKILKNRLFAEVIKSGEKSK